MNKTPIHPMSTSTGGSSPMVQAVGIGKIGLTIDEAADYTSIGRNTLRQLVDWGKIPVLRIGRKSIIRTDVICAFMEINEGHDLLDRAQVQEVY